MFSAGNGAAIERLYKGDAGAYDNDESSADLALCNHLAFWTGRDAGRMDRMFRQSGLMRGKWDRNARAGETYGAGTIRVAIAACAEVYQGKRTQAKAQTELPPEYDDHMPPDPGEEPTEATTKAADGEKPKMPLSQRVRAHLCEKWGYTFAENALDDSVLVNGAPIDTALRSTIKMQARDAGYGGKGKPLEAVEDMINVIARENRFHPIRDWLNGLQWDGQNHLRALAGHFTDAHPPLTYSDGASITVFRTFFTRWAVGCVARVFEGGAIQNPMLVLDGEQGIGKSYLAAWLCSALGNDYFMEQGIDPHSPDHARYLATKWIWEVGELGSSLRRADRDALKRFITQRAVTFRIPYAKDAVVKPAMANFIGTLNNESGFLSDPTGNRRFLPVELKAIDRTYATALDPAQLWAQALHLYRSGWSYQLTPMEEAVRDGIHKVYEAPSDEKEAIVKYYEIDLLNAEWKVYTNDVRELLEKAGMRTSNTRIGTALRSLMGKPSKEIRRGGQRAQGYTGIRLRDGVVGKRDDGTWYVKGVEVSDTPTLDG